MQVLHDQLNSGSHAALELISSFVPLLLLTSSLPFPTLFAGAGDGVKKEERASYEVLLSSTAIRIYIHIRNQSN
jgi:hypothetical protein